VDGERSDRADNASKLTATEKRKMKRRGHRQQSQHKRYPGVSLLIIILICFFCFVATLCVNKDVYIYIIIKKDDIVQYALRYSHVFFPVVVDTLGPLSDAEIGRRATLCTANPRETTVCTFLYQRIQWQFSVSTQYALPTRSQFSSTHQSSLSCMC